MNLFSIKNLSKIGGTKGLFLFLDFDGTLSPLVSDPTQAVLLPGLKRTLTKLATYSTVRIMIISGRSLADLRKRVGIPGLIYAGNHGCEIFFKKRYLLRKGEKYKPTFARPQPFLKNS